MYEYYEFFFVLSVWSMIESYESYEESSANNGAKRAYEFTKAVMLTL